jgi:hypothetical protein
MKHIYKLTPEQLSQANEELAKLVSEIGANNQPLGLLLTDLMGEITKELLCRAVGRKMARELWRGREADS